MILNPSYEYISELLARHAPKGTLHIIDYGCGNGYLLDVIPSERIENYTGFDVSSDSIRVAQERNLPSRFQFKQIEAGSVPVLGKPSNADVVILVGVLQYLTEKEIKEVIVQAQKVLRPGGVFIASCVVDHPIYVWANLYQFVFPNKYIHRNTLLRMLQEKHFRIEKASEKGLFLNPFVFHGLVIFFDAIDRFLFGVRGRLGFLGTGIRRIVLPLLRLEFKLPFDFGYTLFLVARKD